LSGFNLTLPFRFNHFDFSSRSDPSGRALENNMENLFPEIPAESAGLLALGVALGENVAFGVVSGRTAAAQGSKRPIQHSALCGVRVQTRCDQVSDIEPDLNHRVQNDQQTRREFAVAIRYPGLACVGCQVRSRRMEKMPAIR
jgi:hypothetical protein